MNSRLVLWLVKKAIDKAKKTPYFNLSGYMNRTWLIPKPEGKEIPPWWRLSARIHEILRSDADRHLHDHPAWNISVILDGSYLEVMPVEKNFWTACQRRGKRFKHVKIDEEWCYAVERKPGDIIFRRATDRHRLVVSDGKPVKTLFIMGPKRQEWGFYVPNQGKVYWRAYLDEWSEE